MEENRAAKAIIAVVIPAYRASGSILGVLSQIDDGVDLVIVVDDACPESTGLRVQAECVDPRVHVIFNERNQGVGGAMVAGYRKALELGATVCVKLDADGQMDPTLIPRFVQPILAGDADYTKGNRFFHVRDVAAMPPVRLIGNAGLSFLCKLSSGYWNLFDPTNGYTAIHADCLREVELDKLEKRYFFESDLLFRLHLVDAVVQDVPMRAVYEGEHSSLNPAREIPRFARSHVRNFLKRVFYEYFLRDFSLASVQLLGGVALLAFALVHGGWTWAHNVVRDIESPAGTIAVVSISAIVGFVLLQGFFAFDYSRIPRRAMHRLSR
ncbi:glycosyltransferase family 2 protein [Stenotrophomonas sp. MH1]|uniref:Glycosyltransferase family 2 protein n=1 Tax=Stenotrophomonas capsici TaxID=3110230 RepID=A0ABU5V0L5_9GAMM|nr:glycosyltransferase family 2 protein [Stenotrophomonas sp. MH1]MEA5666879.1 glycosyltransferase family 2 protein [Stenotrophomonas sp. MH1]